MSDINQTGKLELWVEERHQDTIATRFRVKKVLFSGRSAYQQVDIVESDSFGRMLLNDGLVMISERDEFVYHEMIAHVPLFVHPNPRHVLVVGGGDGGTAREVIRHSQVEECRMIEIDQMVVESSKEFLSQTASCLRDPRVNLTIEDGVKFVAKTDEKFDVVIVDSTDPIGPAVALFGEDFYQNVHRILTARGIVVSQGESPFFESETQKRLLSVLSRTFERTHIYNYSNITYPGGLWSFTFASKGLCPLASFDSKRVDDAKMQLFYYNPMVHRAAFALPTFMRQDLDEFLTPFY